jgi:hypothetical protein
VFAAVCVPLAALGHILMSGSEVPAWALAAGAGVTGLVGWGLAGRERGLPLIVTVVVAAQTVLHAAFSLAQSTTGASDASASMHMTSMDMGPMPGFDDGIALLDLLAALPEERREAFVLTQLVGLAYSEVSDCPVGTVRSRVARARATLTARLEETEEPATPAAV